MISEDILLEQLPAELRQLIVARDIEAIVGYFFEYDIEERRIADALSRYAIVKDEGLLHSAAAEVYMHCLPYLDDAFQLAFYHQWRELELTEFNDQVLLRSFLQNKIHPDFELIPAACYEFVEDKLFKYEGKNLNVRNNKDC
ncbi:hypothetical protein [Macrococcus carouselicus]|nr:hypothetical protein [Macrococcus carouselicus]